MSKTVRIFLGGDYEFLCENFDQSGAASLSFCLWCPVSKGNKRDDPMQMEEVWGVGDQINTLESLKLRARRKKEPIVRVQLDRVVVLPLHITLGLTAAYLNLLKDDVRSSRFFFLLLSSLHLLVLDLAREAGHPDNSR